jgi:dTMP kinase
VPTERNPTVLPPIPKRATLVAFEGIDGSGKTTAATLVSQRLTAAGFANTIHRNRSLGPVRIALDSLADAEGYRDRFDMFGADTAQFMGALLKWRELLDIAPLLERDGHVVIVDRYLYTHLALAAVHETANADRLRRLFGVFPAPDVVMFIDVPPALAVDRVRKRGRDANSLDFLTRLREGFLALPEMQRFHVLDGTADPAVVAERAWQLVVPYCQLTCTPARPGQS